MAFLILFSDLNPKNWVKYLRRQDPDLDLRIWPEVGDPAEIRFALTWKHPPGELRNYPNLACIASLGVGVDHILRDPDLPPGVPITRVVDPSMAQGMTEYVVMAVLNHCRQTADYFRHQQAAEWKIHIPMLADRIGVGILGLGQLGADAAQRLTALGFNVAGWSRSRKTLDKIASYWGGDQLGAFLSRTDILICLLPLTPDTRDILNAELFSGLRPGAFLVNPARGEHLVEDDLLAALDGGRLGGACLDVFRTEPLPPGHPFWTHPKITITPHVASLTNPAAVVPRIYDNYRRVLSGQAPLYTIDRTRGY